MNRTKLRSLLTDRGEHAVATRAAQVLQLAYARHHGVTHEALSEVFDRTYQNALEAMPAASVRLMKGPFAREILQDRLELESDQKPSLKRTRTRIKEKERGL